MKKTLTIVLAGLLAFGAAWAKETIKVGVVCPMSGAAAAVKELAFIMEKRAAELSADPQSHFNYELIIEDSQFEPKRSHLAATKLLGQNHVDALITIAATSARVIDPLAARAEVPQLAISSEDPSWSKWTFTYFITAADEGALLVSTSRALGYKSFVYMTQRQAATDLLEKSVVTAAKKARLKNLGTLWWNASDAQNFRTHLLKAREAKPDCIIYPAVAGDADNFLRQARELGVSAPIVGAESFDCLADKSLIEGRWLAGIPPMSAELRARLKAYGITANLNYDPYAYDLPGILAQAVESASTKAGGAKPTPAQIRDALEGLKTVQTSFGAVAQAQNAFHPKPVLVYYENGAGREVTLDELLKLKH